MIHIELKLTDGRIIPVMIRERHYRKLTAKIEQLSFWDKVKLLFIKRKKEAQK